MHLSTLLLPLILLPFTTPLPTSSNTLEARTHTHLHRRNYSASLLGRIKARFRANTSVAPGCNGCPEPSLEEKICVLTRYPIQDLIRFPPDPQRTNKTDERGTEVTIGGYYPPVDARCVDLLAVQDAYGMRPKDVEAERVKFGFAGYPVTGEQILKKVMVQAGWDEEKARRMLDLVAPGWEGEADEEVEEVRRRRVHYVDERENPFNLPAHITVRMLPPGPVQEEVRGCSAWEVARRGDGCGRLARRVGLGREQFMKRNPAVMDKDAVERGDYSCKHLWAGYAYCVDGGE